MNKTMKLTTGLFAGAGLMYLFDPVSGHRRRALLRDKLVHLTHVLRDTADKRMRDAAHRAYGTFAEFRGRLTEGRVSDDILVQRVRSQLGRLVSHPHAIHVAAHDGTIVLSGPILTKEKDALLMQARSVRGVLNVENRLETHDEPNGISSLQG